MTGAEGNLLYFERGHSALPLVRTRRDNRVQLQMEADVRRILRRADDPLAARRSSHWLNGSVRQPVSPARKKRLATSSRRHSRESGPRARLRDLLLTADLDGRVSRTDTAAAFAGIDAAFAAPARASRIGPRIAHLQTRCDARRRSARRRSDGAAVDSARSACRAGFGARARGRGRNLAAQRRPSR